MPKLLHACAAVLLASGIADPIMAQEDSCTGPKATVDDSAKKYKSVYDGYGREGEDIKTDAVALDGTVSWKDTEIVFDTPTVTVKDQKMVFGVPQTTVTDREIIFGTPSVRMARVKIGQYPETFCEDTWIRIGGFKTKGVPTCTVRWSNMYADVPETFMQEHRIVLGIPEFKWDDTTIILGVPQFSMQRQRWVVGLPQFTVTSVIINPGPIRDRSSALQDRIAETRKSQQREMADNVGGVFSCYRTALLEKRGQTAKLFDVSLNQMDSVVTSLHSQGADPTRVPGENGSFVDMTARRADLARKRDESLATFDKALADLDTSEKDAVGKISGSARSA